MNIGRSVLLVLALVALVAAGVWYSILFESNSEEALYFFNVGQGDAQMIAAGRARFLIDTGPDSSVLGKLGRALPFLEKRIDVIFLSHIQQDHAGGVFELIDRYDVGVVAWNGVRTPLWEDLSKRLAEKDIAVVELSAGDSVSFKDHVVSVLWPQASDVPPEVNNTSLVLRYRRGDLSALFTRDVSDKVEKTLTRLWDIDVDVLKVAHHGSKYASSAGFLSEASPALAVVGVGKNSYGHPTEEALARLNAVGSRILRTDADGTIKLVPHNAGVDVFSLTR
jgi:competence protein ComEC